jgi:hypothetical protein
MFCVKTLKGNVIWYLDVHSDGPDRQPFRQRKFQEMLGTKYCLEKIYSTEERALKLFMQINKKICQTTQKQVWFKLKDNKI